MTLEIFTLCDHGQDFQGKLVIVGTFDTIWAQDFPVLHPLCSVALRMRFARKEIGLHKISLRVIDANNKELIPPIVGEANVLAPPNNDQEHSTINAIINLANLNFPNPGRYSVEFKLDDETYGLAIYLAKQNR